MAADYAALEARVAELEQQMRHIVPARIDAVAYGVSLLHEDVREVRATQAEHGMVLSDIRDSLGEILRRLPGGTSNGPSGAGDDH
ncbi:MAG: hypothetical protein ACRDPO_14610 [Streptosporangiaceae bacterium]